MRLPVAAALLAAALGVPFAPASAAPPKPPSCNLVKDATGDATPLANGVASPRNDDGMDIKELDVATDFTRLAGVVRLYSLSTADAMSPTGRLVTFTATVKNRTYAIRTLLAMNGTQTSDKGATAVVDPTTFELRFTTTLAALGIKGLTVRDKVTKLEATTVRWHGDLATGQQLGDVVDVASGPVAYPHAARSCVRIGS